MATRENSTKETLNRPSSPESCQSDSGVVKFSVAEEDLVLRMYKLVGERWGLIAGRIPGRTAEEIKKYWRSKYP